MVDSAGPSNPPEEQSLQLQLYDGAGDDGQRRFDIDGGCAADDVVNMAWCDNRLSATAANVAATIVGMALVWSVLYLNVSGKLMAVPNGSLSSIFILHVTGVATGWLLNRTVGLPPRFGMLLAGIALKYADLYNVDDWCRNLISFIR